jgi:RND superfamily putative drug exporter
VDQLRPSARSALILVRFRVSLDQAVERIVPKLNALLKRQISHPVSAVQSGYATLSRAIQDEAARATQRGELIAIPLVLMVLLLVFRSPIAASIPLVLGGATVAASRGVLSIAANWLSIDAFALTASAMMGLALGIDYTLLMVSRFRELLASGMPAPAAAAETRRTAGRTIAFAGGALFLSMVASALVLPGTFLVSLAGAVVVVTALSVILGIWLLPALLGLLGPRINKWSVGGRHHRPSRWLGGIDRVLRRPTVVVPLLTIPLVLLALPAVSLSVGPPTPEQLPPTNQVRLDAELINREVGPGWATPYVVLATAGKGAITDKTHLATLKRWERMVGRGSDVQAVFGPGVLARRLRPFRQAGNAILAQDRPGSRASVLTELGGHLTEAARGVGTLRNGIATATAGAALLAKGSSRVAAGSRVMGEGLASASVGSERATKALGRLGSGADRIHHGQHQAALGALALSYDIQDLIPKLRHSTLVPSEKLEAELKLLGNTVPGLETRSSAIQERVGVALRNLREIEDPPADPRYAAAIEALEAAEAAAAGPPGSALSTELATLGSGIARSTEFAAGVRTGLAGGLEELHDAGPLATKLARGLDRLERGTSSLDSGAQRLAHAATSASEELPRLTQGAAALSNGAAQLSEGGSSLTKNLSHAYSASYPLQPGLERAAKRSTAGGTALRNQSRHLDAVSPKIFTSGYFGLAALDGTTPPVRSTVSETVDLDHGGQAAKILVVPRFKRTAALDKRLRADAQQLGQELGGHAGVTGNLAELADYANVSSSKLPIVIAVVSLLTLMSLVAVLRAIPVALIAVMLNLLSVGVAFGVLAMVSKLPAGAPIGHWPVVDTIGAVAIFAIAFGVSIDYSVFILVRMREEFDSNHDHVQAVRAGVRQTGRVITGAALMMVAVFAAFATSDLAIVSQLGTGLTVAILLDATVIRLVLLPALLLWMGERSWWLPGPLVRAFGDLRLT